MNEVCRLCLNNGATINIFDEFSDISKRILLCSSVQVLLNDGYPQCICSKCESNLYAAYIFRQICISSNHKLHTSNMNIEKLWTTNENLSNTQSYKCYTEEDEALHAEQSIYRTSDEDIQCLNIINKETHTEDETGGKELSINNYICNICNCPFKSKRILSNHMAKSHKSKLNKMINTEMKADKGTPEKKTTYQCDVCGKIVRYRVDLIHHLRRHTGDRPFKCNICTNAYITKSALTKHLVKHTGEKLFECNLCPKNFQHQSNLNIHMKVHSGAKNFPCNLCDKKFKYNRTLLLHIKIHTNERNYPCDQCEKAFVNRFDLGRHLKRHEKKMAIANGTYDPSLEPPKALNLQQCEKCGRVCKSGGDLRKHMRCHSTERPFKCSVCKRGFKGSSAMRAHERTHTKIRPYICQQCGRSFSQSSNLKIHERLHTGLRPYQCQNCKKAFNRKRDLQTHQKRHKEENIT